MISYSWILIGVFNVQFFPKTTNLILRTVLRFLSWVSDFSRFWKILSLTGQQHCDVTCSCDHRCRRCWNRLHLTCCNDYRTAQCQNEFKTQSYAAQLYTTYHDYEA
jgi:hypothetical protein